MARPRVDGSDHHGAIREGGWGLDVSTPATGTTPGTSGSRPLDDARAGEARAFYVSFWKGFPDLAVRPAQGLFLHPHAARVAVIWLGAGTHTGPLDPPGLPPTGARIRGHVWEMLEIRDGLVTRAEQTFDSAGMLRQLGILPAPGCFAEHAMLALQRIRLAVSSVLRRGARVGRSR